MAITVCMTCTNRYPACHDLCKDYLQQKQHALNEKHRYLQAHQKDKLYADYSRKRRSQH